MDKKSYTFDDLNKKYDRFSAPCFAISVGGTKLSEDGMTVTSLTSLSAAPPRLLVSINRQASSFAPIARHRLFGVNILMTDPDYRDRFYRIKAVTPFLPREAWMDILTPEAEKEKTEAGAAAKEKAVAAAAKEKMAAAAEKPAAAAEKTAADEKTAAKGGQ